MDGPLPRALSLVCEKPGCSRRQLAGEMGTTLKELARTGSEGGGGVHVLSIGLRAGDRDEMIRFMYPWVHETPVSHLETESYLEIYWILTRCRPP